MKRHEPMKRGAPLRARQAPQRRAVKTLSIFTPRARPIAARVLVHDEFVTTRPKRDYVRSDDLLAACRLIPCQHCGRADGTVCAAHSNWGAHGKGMAIKADDSRVAALCATCHSMLDQGSRLSAAERVELWGVAHVATVMLLTAEGLWPAGVPVPHIESPTGPAARRILRG